MSDRYLKRNTFKSSRFHIKDKNYILEFGNMYSHGDKLVNVNVKWKKFHMEWRRLF